MDHTYKAETRQRQAKSDLTFSTLCEVNFSTLFGVLAQWRNWRHLPDDQTLDLQRDALERAKCRQIYEEHATGQNATRPELDACLRSLRESDTFVGWRLHRLGRSLADLIRLINEFQSRSIELESLTEKIEAGSPTGKLVFHVFGALAEFEHMHHLLIYAEVAGARWRLRAG